MAFSRRRFKKKTRHGERPPKPFGNNNPPAGPVDRSNPESTGSETEYLKSLVDSRRKVTVVLTGGERVSGYIRYYDTHCFSIGITAEGPRFLLRKDSVSYIEDNH